MSKAHAADAAVTAFLDSVSPDRRDAVKKLRDVMVKNLPKGFQEVVISNMLSYVVPHSLYPPGYHCNPRQPLHFISIASQKSHLSLHHLGLYGDQQLLNWFTSLYPEYSTAKLDMGKGCVRFKKMENIPYELIGLLAAKLTPEEWISSYEKAFLKK